MLKKSVFSNVWIVIKILIVLKQMGTEDNGTKNRMYNFCTFKPSSKKPSRSLRSEEWTHYGKPSCQHFWGWSYTVIFDSPVSLLIAPEIDYSWQNDPLLCNPHKECP